MKKLLPLIAITMACASCKSPERKLKESMEPVLKDLVVNQKRAAQIDSIHIYKIDTLTDVKLTQRKASNCMERATDFQNMADGDLKELQSIASKINRKKAEIDLYRDIPSMESVVQQDILEAEDLGKNIKHINDEGTSCLDSVKFYMDRYAMLTKQVKDGKVDNKTFRGYVARFSYKGSDKNNVLVKKDSVYAFLTPNLHIIPLSAM